MPRASLSSLGLPEDLRDSLAIPLNFHLLEQYIFASALSTNSEGKAVVIYVTRLLSGLSSKPFVHI